ncbi:hypothetical protein TcasGA2_TC031674 [Tribolium castaneum]|uniref:Uncharacterized protein n=1 Tax=Tribolium castaneum TaxID=7070 RepID=A0A139W8M3_TRICA|nr:hypothetical protein TcasGA2_TC031674 [Tribolium castaneum]
MLCVGNEKMKLMTHTQIELTSHYTTVNLYPFVNQETN